MRVHHASGPLVLVAASLLGGCFGPIGAKNSPATTEQLLETTEAQLRQDLIAFDAYLQRTVSEVAAEIERRLRTVDGRRAATMWKMRTNEASRAAAYNPSAASGLVDAWALCLRQVQYFEAGDGRDLFGSEQSRAQETARDALARIEEVAARAVEPGRLDTLRQKVQERAAATPLTGLFVQAAPPPAQPGSPGMDMLRTVLDVPLAPVRAVGKVGEGADSLRDMSKVAERFADIVEDLPMVTRWQVELLLLSLEENAQLNRALASFDQVSASAARLAAVAETLPQDMRRELDGALSDLDDRQTELRTTLREARETVAAVDAGLARAETVTATIQRSITEGEAAAKAWEQTARAVEDTVRAIEALRGDDRAGTAAAEEELPGAAERKPFDINDYRQTAESITAATVELRGLLDELRQFTGSDDLRGTLGEVGGRVDETLAQSALAARAVTDHIAWRLLQLIVLVFVLVVVYRVATGRAGRRAAATGA